MRPAAGILVLLLLLAAPACTERRAGGAVDADDLTIFAAASLTDVFTALAARHEQGQPGRVSLSFAGSQQLARQILDGAPADIYAAASFDEMEELVERGLLTPPRTFARNRLAIAVEPGNPLGLDELADLARPDVVLVLPTVHAPAGRYAAAALDAAGVAVTASSYETDVRGALSKVRLGEADAAIVYRSDVIAAGDAVDSIEIPAAHNVEVSYPIAVTTAGGSEDRAAAFVDLLLSSDGRQLLLDHGFALP
jgi:molybdate transport system substrate-binding protein